MIQIGQKSPQTKTIKIALYFFTHDLIETIAPVDQQLHLKPRVSKRGVQKISLIYQFDSNEQKYKLTYESQTKNSLPDNNFTLLTSFKIQGANFDISKVFNLPPLKQLGNESLKNKYFYFENEIYEVKQNFISRPVIISTDIGGTLIGDEEGLKKFNRMYISQFYFDKKNTLIYNSGRSIQSYSKAEKLYNLIKPDYFISRCGVMIYKNVQGGYVADQSWTSQIKIDWDFQKIIEKVENISWLKRKQNEHDQNLCIKFVCPNEVFDEKGEEFYKIEKQLHQECQFECIVRTKTDKKSIDFIPISTNKGQALEYLCKNSIRVDMAYTLAFGDTMNDSAMIEKAGKGILVKNSMPDVINWMQDLQRRRQIEIQKKQLQQQQQELIINTNLCNGNGVSKDNKVNNNSIGINQNGVKLCNGNGVQHNNINNVKLINGQKKDNNIQYNNTMQLSQKIYAQALVEALENVISNQ